MSMFSVNTHRLDPYKTFKFRVRLEGEYIPGITRISPLARATETVLFRDGMDSSRPRLSPGTTQYEPIVLERGLSHDPTFENWANMVFNLDGDANMSLKDYKKDMIIELLNLQGTPVMAFRVYRCWPSEYQPLPELDSNSSCTAMEKIVLQHEGWQRDTAVVEPQES